MIFMIDFPLGSGTFHLKKCRHPVLELSRDSSFIPNDVLLGISPFFSCTEILDSNERMVVLTGANMGGKSTYLRSAALCALMAQIGSFVPASEATISVLDAIYTRCKV